MCGIAGILSKGPIEPERIKKATKALTHRGPEDEGFFINSDLTVALGHRRLCIIDLSEAAKGPFSFRDRYQLVFNGELYNYIELRDDLKKRGLTFYTQSDTEVLVAAYAEWGKDCLQKFDGAFAFAIWDEEEKKLFAARDRFGEKPFFFYYDEAQFVFASEIKALWQAGIEKKVNSRMMYNFLTIGYTSNPYNPQETFFENIQKLPAATFVQFSLHDHSLVIENYSQLHVAVNSDITNKEAEEKFTHLFKASIQKRLRSDVAIGTSLSGGLDSSAIVAFCDGVKSSQYTHKCFTAVFPGFAKDEQQHAALVARQFRLEHSLVTINEDEVADLMTKVMEHQEEPIGSSSALAQYKVHERAKENGVTVVLDGQGADEILGGYHKYYRWHWHELYKQDRALFKKELAAAKGLGVKELFSFQHKIAAHFPQFAGALQQSKKKKRAYSQTDLNRDFAFSNKEHFYYSLPAHFDLNSALHFNTVQNGLEELLRLADRNSMAHGVEVRLPFLSHELVEFLFTLPSHFKIKDGRTKWLLRKTTEPLLPKEIVWRRDKVGFEPPQKIWMQNKKVAESIQEAKRSLAHQGILQKASLSKKLQPHAAHAAESNDWKYWAASYLYTH